MHLLFICSRNRLRSPTAQDIFSELGYEADSAGLAPDADCQLDGDQVDWADIVFVMERRHLSKLRQRFGENLSGKKVVCLDVPDRYEFMQPELVELLRKKVEPYLR